MTTNKEILAQLEAVMQKFQDAVFNGTDDWTQEDRDYLPQIFDMFHSLLTFEDEAPHWIGTCDCDKRK
jgi:hypothetical protein